MEISDLIRESHETAKAKGWWNQEPARSLPEQIALMHSELSEALEEYRKFGVGGGHHGGAAHGTDLYDGLSCEEGDVVIPLWSGKGKPEGIAAEFADVLIRIADTCGKYDIPLEEALKAKLAYNKTRPHRHGGKKC